MERKDHKAIITELLGMVANDHQARASELLTNLSDDYEQVLTTSEQASADVEKLTRNNETLRDVNAKLFLRVGEVVKNTDNNPPTNPDKQEEVKPIPFDTLFNEKGELL